jgi:hypothetical protein
VLITISLAPVLDVPSSLRVPFITREGETVNFWQAMVSLVPGRTSMVPLLTNSVAPLIFAVPPATTKFEFCVREIVVDKDPKFTTVIAELPLILTFVSKMSWGEVAQRWKVTVSAELGPVIVSEVEAAEVDANKAVELDTVRSALAFPYMVKSPGKYKFLRLLALPSSPVGNRRKVEPKFTSTSPRIFKQPPESPDKK